MLSGGWRWIAALLHPLKEEMRHMSTKVKASLVFGAIVLFSFAAQAAFIIPLGFGIQPGGA